MFQIHPDKAPGPDGFNAAFYQRNWMRVGEEVTVAIQSFFTSGRLIKEINHTFVTLVPKTTCATSLADYRPISCCNVLYKCLSKVLCNRLKQVVGELISGNQCAFSYQGGKLGIAHYLHMS